MYTYICMYMGACKGLVLFSLIFLQIYRHLHSFHLHSFVSHQFYCTEKSTELINFAIRHMCKSLYIYILILKNSKVLSILSSIHLKRQIFWSVVYLSVKSLYPRGILHPNANRYLGLEIIVYRQRRAQKHKLQLTYC